MIANEQNLKKSVLDLALPAVAEQTLVMIVGVVSTILVGHIGKQALSAVGIVNQTIQFILVLSVALSTGSTVLVARLIGEGKRCDAREAMRQTVVLGTAGFLLVSALCWLAADPIVRLFFGQAEEAVLTDAVLYFRISMFGLPFLLVNTIISGNMRGAGNTRTPMLIASVVNLINLGLGLVLIFGVSVPAIGLQVPSFGVAGAAWAVAVSRMAGGLISAGWIRFVDGPLKSPIFKGFRLRLDLLRRIGNIGLPAMGEQVVMQGGFLMIQVVLSGIGTTAMAVMQIGNSVNSIAFIPTWGFGLAAMTLIGQCLGEERPEVAQRAGWEASRISMWVSVSLTTLLFIFAPQLVAAYTQDPEVRHIGVIAIRIFSLSQPALSLVVVYSSALRGAGDIKYVMLTSFVGIWGMRLLITLAMHHIFHLGALSVWVAYGMDFLVRAVMYSGRFRAGRWKLIKV